MKKLARLLIILCITGFIINVVWKRLIKPNELISPIPNIQVKKTVTPSPTSLPVSDSLKMVVEGALTGTKGTYGIAIKNLLTGEAYYSNEHRVYEPGSLYKLWVMSTVFGQMENGEIAEDEILTDSIKQLNKDFNIDPEFAELTEGTISLSVNDALNQMITISHNYAAMLLTKKVEFSSIGNFLVKKGFSESMVGEPPKTTSYDIALFFEKLYKGQLVNEESTKKMIDILKKQTLNEKLPKYLPQNITVAHKTGEIDYLSHDGGIVFTGKGDYIIVVLSETDFPAVAEERIAQISKAVYDYFTSKQTNGKN